MKDMNWNFILKWVITFTVATAVYTLTGSFWMSLGIMILLVVVWSYVQFNIQRQRMIKKFKEDLEK